MTNQSTCVASACKAMRASRVNVLAAWTKMGFTEVCAQSKPYCDVDRFVVQPQATAGDWQCMQPVAAVWRRYGEQLGFVSRVEGGRLQGCNFGEYSWPVPCVLTVGGCVGGARLRETSCPQGHDGAVVICWGVGEFGEDEVLKRAGAYGRSQKG